MKIVIIGLALAAALAACSFKSERTVQNPPAATTTTTVPAPPPPRRSRQRRLPPRRPSMRC